MFKEYLRDKRVVLVAPGAQTELMKLGEEIDSYDVVARIGNYAPLVHEEVGSRTDVVCENFWFWSPKFNWDYKALYEAWVSQGVRWFNHVWCDNEGVHNLTKINRHVIPINTQKIAGIEAIRKTLNSPTKGACAIWDMLDQPIKELFLVGFSFCRGFGYRNDFFFNPHSHPTYGVEYKNPLESVNELNKWVVKLAGYDHDLQSELNWFKSIKDPRLRCDEWLTRLCE